MELAYLRDETDRDARVGRRLLYLATCLAVTIMGFSWYSGLTGDENRGLTVERVRQIQDALDRYAVDNGGILPSARQGLQALISEPDVEPRPRNWRGPYVEKPEILGDAWGFPFHYVVPGGGDPKRPYDLWSLGRNDMEGGKGDDADIKSWAPETMTHQ